MCIRYPRPLPRRGTKTMSALTLNITFFVAFFGILAAGKWLGFTAILNISAAVCLAMMARTTVYLMGVAP